MNTQCQLLTCSHDHSHQELHRDVQQFTMVLVKDYQRRDTAGFFELTTDHTVRASTLSSFLPFYLLKIDIVVLAES